MADLIDFAPGGFRFIPSVFQYSGGVAALPGYAIRRVRFRRPRPLEDGFAFIEDIIRQAGRPLTSFCACELRSPAPFDDAGFRAFNEAYVRPLREWGLVEGDVNPVARTNVCPEVDPPREPCFHAFAFTVEAGYGPPTFTIAGSGEAKEGGDLYADSIVRRGETSPDAIADKVRAVVGEMERRLALLGFAWRETTATQAYTVHDFHPVMAADIVARGAAPGGLVWHFARPPVLELEFEMDCRGIALEEVL